MGLNAVFLTIFSVLDIPIETVLVPQGKLRQVGEAWAASIHGAEDGHWCSSGLYIQIFLFPRRWHSQARRGEL